MANLKELPKTEVISRLQNARNRLQRMKKETEQITGRVVSGTMIVGGGAVAGALEGFDVGDVPGTEIPWSAAIAAALGTAAIFDLGGQYNEQMGDVAFGMGAAVVAPKVATAVRDMRNR